MSTRKRYLELVQNVYTGDKFWAYMKKKDQQDDEEMEQWKRDSMEAPTPPPPMKGKLYIDAEEIVSFSQSFSLEEAVYNPENPTFDCVEIVLRNRDMYTVVMDIEDFVSLMRESTDGMA